MTTEFTPSQKYKSRSVMDVEIIQSQLNKTVSIDNTNGVLFITCGKLYFDIFIETLNGINQYTISYDKSDKSAGRWMFQTHITIDKFKDAFNYCDKFVRMSLIMDDIQAFVRVMNSEIDNYACATEVDHKIENIFTSIFHRSICYEKHTAKWSCNIM